LDRLAGLVEQLGVLRHEGVDLPVAVRAVLNHRVAIQDVVRGVEHPSVLAERHLMGHVDGRFDVAHLAVGTTADRAEQNHGREGEKQLPSHR
jgi:hypothetical protein